MRSGGDGRDAEADVLVSRALRSPQMRLLTKEFPETQLRQLVRVYYRHVAAEDLEGRSDEDLLGAVVGQRLLAQQREPGSARVHAYTPTVDEAGWSCGHSVLDVIADDTPFVVDSVVAALTQAGRAIHLVIHPQVIVHRDANGDLIDIPAQRHRRAPGKGKAGGESESAGLPEQEITESWLHVEFGRESDPQELASLTRDVSDVLADVRAAVTDWKAMSDKAIELAAELQDRPPPTVEPDEVAEAVALLRWLEAQNFTFLGYREYALAVGADGWDMLVPDRKSGLGILRDDSGTSESFSALPPQAQARAREPHVLVLTKANRRATVHRPAYLDYIGVKRFDDDGAVVGERRFLGLFSSSAYTQSVEAIPVLRRTVAQVMVGTGFEPGSHNARDLTLFCETYPRDELFQVAPDELLPVALDVLRLAERRRTRAYVRRDAYGRFVSVLLYLPRDRYTTEVRLRVSATLREAYGAESIDYSAQISESVVARLHFVVRMARGVPVPEVDSDLLSERLADAVRSWTDLFGEALLHEFGEEEAAELQHRYADGIAEAYKEDISPRVAVADIRRLEELDAKMPTSVALHLRLGSAPHEPRFSIYRLGRPVPLSEVLPIFASLGAEVLDERPYSFRRSDGSEAWVYDVGLRLPVSDPASLEGSTFADRFCFAFTAAWFGLCEIDRFNGLVVSAGMSWQEVALVRAWAQYARQLGSPMSVQFSQDVMLAHPQVASLLVSLFETRHDPSGDGPDAAREERAQAVDRELMQALDRVPALDDDRLIRQLRGIVHAVLRTNAYQVGEDGLPRSALAFKLDPQLIPGVPAPTPRYEIWVTSPQLSGVHLRFGAVARGGVRWSDRREDVRTEILGLAKAQMVKNAVIVPVGAKGGFVLKQHVDHDSRAIWQSHGVSAYSSFVSALLDVTDNISGGQIVHPAQTICRDGPDPYLVVAADKGTATFSDLANEVATKRGFWLGDAFASGGSAGYDHKAMGITARGAWESAKRHFRELGVDVQTEPFTVAGIGDMSGDVFGNAMLLSRHIRLVAAFDHRHIFLDPEPDPDPSFEERARLAAMPRSSWINYDAALISEGGGVFPRSAKSVPVSAQLRRTLDLPEDIEALTPAELIRAILRAPVDLLFNGGIGTYVKASWESDEAVGDKANDAVRVTARELRCQVVVEGGNLGFTQPGRVEASRRGVHINTDAIDNSAGVDLSDHEVNLKILLDAVVDDGDLTLKQRNLLLAEVGAEVADLVLRDNYEQNLLLGTARSEGGSMLQVHRRMIDDLQARDLLDRDVEHLPSDVALTERAEVGQGLCSPELAVLIAYSKIALTGDIMASGLAEEPWYQRMLSGYFPPRISERFPGYLGEHRLRKEITSTVVSNDVINRGGISFVHRAVEETGAPPVEVIRAYTVTREVFALPGIWRRIEELDGVVPTAAQTALRLESRRVLDRATRWLLTLRGGPLDVEAEIRRFAPTVAELGPLIPELLVGVERDHYELRARDLIRAGAPADLAYEVAAGLDVFSLLDVHELAVKSSEDPAGIARVYFALSEQFGVDELLSRITRLPRGDRWYNLARASLRSDLYAALASLCSRVLRSTSAGDPAGERIAGWERQNPEGHARVRATLAEIFASDRVDLATLSVALRAIRTLVHQVGTAVRSEEAGADPAG